MVLFGLMLKRHHQFEFYQYWRNVDDADVVKCLKNAYIPSFRRNREDGTSGREVNLIRLRKFLLMNLLNLFMVKKKLKKHRLHQETFLQEVELQATFLQQHMLRQI